MSKRDQDVRFIKMLMRNFGIVTNVAQLCRVTRFENKDHSKVDVQPLARTQSGNKRGLLINVHVGRLLRNELKIGDVVVVTFIDRSTENWDGSNRDYYLASDRTHSVNDAFVIEVY